MRKIRSSGEIFGLAFLDVIACGFGAIVLLLLISKPALVDGGGDARAPVRESEIEAAADLVARLRERWEELQVVPPPRAAPPAEAAGEEAALKEAIRAAGRKLEQLQQDNQGLERVRESLRRATLRTRAPVTERDPEVGGIPVDSEYVIFIVDTSGSMKEIWDRVMEVMNQVLDVHPRVSGFQVLNDDGGYLVNAYRRKWIPDTPRRRGSILDLVRSWNAFSNSSPVEGLETALRHYARQDRKIAIYIFGDDYTGASYDEVIETLRELNTERGTGRRLVRVHAVGFVSDHGTERYATLMREVTRTNEGTFLALPR